MAIGSSSSPPEWAVARPLRYDNSRWGARGELSKRVLNVVAGLTALGVVVFLAWNAGGYFAPDLLTGGAITFGVLTLLILLGVLARPLSVATMVALGSLFALAAWTGLSASWSPAPDGALHAMQRDVVHAGFLILGIMAVGSGRYARELLWGVLAVAMLIVLAGLASRIAPGLVHGVRVDPVLDGYRLSYPLGYWNAFGALAAFATVLALGLAADPRTHVALRAGAGGAAVLSFVAMYLSLSRGAWLSLGLGLVVLLLLGAHRGSLLLAVAVTGVASALAVVRLGSYPALVSNPHRGSGQAAQAHAYLPQLLVIVAVAVVVMALVAAGRASPNLMQAMGRVGRPVGLAIAAAVVLIAIIGYAVDAGGIDGRAARGLDDSSHFVSRQWHDFMRPGTFSASGTARLTTARGTRSELWGRAFDGFEAHPLRGDGGGAFPIRWIRTRRVDEKVENAHSLGFETLGELGAIGGLLLLTFLGSLVTATVRARRRTGALPRAQVAAVGGACSVWLASSMVDWQWQVSAFTGLALVAVATVLPVGRVRRRRSSAT